MASVLQNGNSYRIRVSSGYDNNGKQIIRSKTWHPEPGMTPTQIEKELERLKVDFEREVMLGTSLDRTVRFSEFADRWMETYCRPNLRSHTIRNYENCLKRINVAFGNKKMCEIQPFQIVKFYTDLDKVTPNIPTRYKAKVDFTKYLKTRKMTKSALCNASGVSRCSITNLCKGSNIQEGNAVKLCAALGCDFKTLFAPVHAVKPLSADTKLSYHRVLSTIFATAYQWQIIDSNPCQRVKAPKSGKKEAKYLEPEDAMRLLECLENENVAHRASIVTLLYSGMRRGELCGLTWNDVNLETGMIDINKTEQYTPKTGIVEDETKNASSKRIIKVPPEVVEVLKEHKLQQSVDRLKAEEWIDTGKVFTQRNGLPINPDSLTRYLKEIVNRYNLPPVTIHGLRHTNASLLIAAGTDIRTVSNRLGHADMSTTMNIYTHAIRKVDEAAAEAISLSLLRRA